MNSTDLAAIIDYHEKHLGLEDLQVRLSVGGYQAIAKYEGYHTAEWGCGCEPGMTASIVAALKHGEALMADRVKKPWTKKKLPKRKIRLYK